MNKQKFNYYNSVEKTNNKKRPINYGNRGMLFEKIIENTNKYYKRNGDAYVRKIPTPVKVLGFTENGMIEGFYESRSALDFNGVLKGGRHIDFDTKETKSKTSFPFGNVSNHQFKYMKEIEEFGGITFLLVSFKIYNEAYILRLSDINEYLKHKPNKKSIEYSYFKDVLSGNLVPITFKNGVYMYDYLETLDKINK